MEQSITGRQLGRETVVKDSVYQEFRDRNEMMSRLDTRTTMRASRTLAANRSDASKYARSAVP